MSIVTSTDCPPGDLPLGGSREDGVLTVGVGSRARGGDRPTDLEVLEVQPDLADVLGGPADGQLAGRAGAGAAPPEVSVVQQDGALTSN